MRLASNCEFGIVVLHLAVYGSAGNESFSQENALESSLDFFIRGIQSLDPH